MARHGPPPPPPPWLGKLRCVVLLGTLKIPPSLLNTCNAVQLWSKKIPPPPLVPFFMRWNGLLGTSRRKGRTHLTIFEGSLKNLHTIHQAPHLLPFLLPCPVPPLHSSHGFCQFLAQLLILLPQALKWVRGIPQEGTRIDVNGHARACTHLYKKEQVWERDRLATMVLRFGNLPGIGSRRATCE